MSATAQVPKVEIELFPDSGHHYFFIPIDLELFGAKRQSIRMECIAESEWCDIAGLDDSKHWLRFRLANRTKEKGGDLEVGIWLVVETNLGPVTRGSVLVPKEPVEKYPWPGQSPSPYARESVLQIPEDSKETIPLHYKIDGETVHFCDVELRWAKPLASEPIDVDLIVDFGNTRTVALLLEYVPNPPGSPGAALVSLIKPVKFARYAYNRENETSESHIIDSWFVLQEPEFAAFEPPNITEQQAVEELVPGLVKQGLNPFASPVQVVEAVIRRMPQTFVELTPAVLAGEAREALAKLNLSGGGITFLSSPKRYAWDSEVEQADRPVAWTMYRVDRQVGQNKNKGQNPMLAGQVLRFFPSSGADWEINDPPVGWAPAQRPHAAPVLPTFPRADALSWMGLAVIEHAYRQINAKAHWANNYPYVRRRLRSVIVTHPSGWTGAELRAYKAKWRKAVFSFAHGHLADPVAEVPAIDFPIDEAVASQLPILFGEIQSLDGVGDNWLNLVGRIQPGTDKCVARIMALDIGGGTTDISIVEYADKMPGPGVHLEAGLLFKDSSTIAGDSVVKALIERILLPKLRSRFSGDNEFTFDDLFSRGFPNNIDKEKWKRITRLVLIPLVTHWLTDLTNKREPVDNFGALHGATLDELNREGIAAGLPEDTPVIDASRPLEVTKDEVNEVIKEQLQGMVESLSKYITAFDVDLVIVAGKPSELPVLRQMLERALPIELDRIITVKDFPIGNWYPFATHGRISDAKTVTATGLALYQAIKEGRIPQWHIEIRKSMAPMRHYWLLLPNQVGPKPQLILDREQDIGSVMLMPGARIARRLLPSSLDPEPTYILRWRNSAKPRPASLTVTIRRSFSEGSDSMEELAITAVDSADNAGSVLLSDVSLDVCTLSSEEYWIDEARFTPSFA